MRTPLQAGLQVCQGRLDPGARTPLVVAFSGGGDSLALLLAARAWARQCGRPLLALHVDHGLQSRSAAFAARAAAAARRLEVPFRILSWEGAKPATGVPSAARAARHRLLADAARAAGAEVILFGHTLDDQLENAVMRGAGVPVGALSEWSPSPVWPQGRGLFCCRPLLTARRAALRGWLAAEGLTWIEDPANTDPRHPRTQARRLLDEGLEPLVSPMAQIGGLAKACRVTSWGAIEIDRTALRTAPEPQALRLIQIALACAAGAAGPGRASALLRRLRGAEAFTASLSGARIMAGGDIRMVREAGEAARGGLAPIDLQPGEEQVWDGRWAVRVEDAGVRVQALSGLAARLEPSDGAFLRAIPASDRPSLPVLRDAQGRVRLASLAVIGQTHHINRAKAEVHALVEPRVRSACGLIAREDQVGTNAHMAEIHRSTYVGTEVKG